MNERRLRHLPDAKRETNGNRANANELHCTASEARVSSLSTRLLAPVDNRAFGRNEAQAIGLAKREDLFDGKPVVCLKARSRALSPDNARNHDMVAAAKFDCRPFGPCAT